jgi:O-antigen/teichoic acid export membrane protein
MTAGRTPEEDVPVAPLVHHEFDDPLDGASSPELEAAPPERHHPPSDLKEKTARSIIWTIARTGSDYIFSFAVFAVLARRLGPEAFGVFALAVAFAEFGKILPAAGLAIAIQRAKQVTPAMADTVFWTSLALAFVVAGALAILAGPIANAFDEPAVAPLLIALGGILVISVGGAIHIALLLREFGHRAMATRSVVSNLLGGGAALAAAAAGWGAWSLVVQRGVAEVAGTAMAWQAYRWMPGKRFSVEVLRGLAGFGASMTLTQVLFVALVRVQDVIIGRTIGIAAVGVYRTAWRTVELIAQGVIMPFSQVSLPTLGRLQDDLPAFRKAYLRIISVSAALAFPAIIGFAVLAPDAIPLVFGDQWEASARIAQVLGFMALPFTLNRFAGPALATLGQSGMLAKIAALQLALTVVMTLAAAPYGLVAIAAAYVARAYLLLPIQMWALRKHSGLGYGAVLASIAPALCMSLVMAGALLALGRLIGARIDSRTLYLLVMVVSGAAVYTASLLLFARRFVAQQLEDFKRLLPGVSAKFSGAGA